MIDQIVNELNYNHLSYCIEDLYEENDTDYVLLNVEKEMLIALAVIYVGKSVSFSRLCQSKREQIISIFTDRFMEDRLHALS